jgi:hypothetical protein
MIAEATEQSFAQTRYFRAQFSPLESRRVAFAQERAPVLSQDELEWQCGVHRADMGFVEQGRYRISVEKLVQVCTGLKLKPSELLAWIDF